MGGGTLDLLGNIIFSPTTGGNILKVSLSDYTTQLVDVGGVYYGITLSPNNGKCYAVGPVANILIFDSSDNTYTIMDTGDTSGNRRFGIVLANNGKIYSLPRSAGNILEIGVSTAIADNTVFSRYINKGF